MLSRLIEADRRHRTQISNERVKDAEALRKYWSEPQHLKDKLHQVAGTIAQYEEISSLWTFSTFTLTSR